MKYINVKRAIGRIISYKLAKFFIKLFLFILLFIIMFIFTLMYVESV